MTWTLASRFADAETWFQRALALDPHNLNAQTGLSDAIVYASGDVSRALAAAPGDAPASKLQRVMLLTLQRNYRKALTLLDTVPGDPDNFIITKYGKALWQAELYRLLGDDHDARPLYAQALSKLEAQEPQQQGINKAFVLQNLATAQLGLGKIDTALKTIAQAQAIVDASHDHAYGPQSTQVDAALYAEARRPDLAVPLLAKALAQPSLGVAYSPTLLWIDPAWDPIRRDPGFIALLAKYAKDQPATRAATPGVPPSA